MASDREREQTELEEAAQGKAEIDPNATELKRDLTVVVGAICDLIANIAKFAEQCVGDGNRYN